MTDTVPRAAADALLSAVQKFTIVCAFGGNGVPDRQEWDRLGAAAAEYERIRDRHVNLTPTELGREVGMHRREVIGKCSQLGVTIFLGRINLGAFKAALAGANESETGAGV